jgi:hypothetical protein
VLTVQLVHEYKAAGSIPINLVNKALHPNSRFRAAARMIILGKRATTNTSAARASEVCVVQ